MTKSNTTIDENTAHFAAVEGKVFCFGVPPEVREAIEQYLPYCYTLLSTRPLAALQQLNGPLRRRILIFRWVGSNAKRTTFLIRKFRNRFVHLPICVWCPTSAETIPTHLLSDGTIDRILCGEPSPLDGAVLANLMLHADKVQSLEALCENLARTSSRDSLTGLLNHGTILKELDNEYRRAGRSKSPLSCLMLDIDHFKTLNDTYGHRYGDFILRELAKLLVFHIRTTDIVGRYGGEEFLIVLPDTNEEGAYSLAEKIRVAVEEHVFESNELRALVTVSIGLASTSVELGGTAEHLLQLSDRALYFAKESGRNRVASAHERPSLSELAFEGQYRRQFVDHSLPVVALCSTDGVFVQRMAKIAHHQKLLLLVFEKSTEFFGALEALEPDLALIDRATDLPSDEFVRQLAARLHTQHIAVGVILDENTRAIANNPTKGADFYVERTATDDTIQEVLRLVLRWTTLEHELTRMKRELGQMSRRLRRCERLATLGELTKGVIDEFSHMDQTSADSKAVEQASLDETSPRCQTLREKLVQLTKHLEHTKRSAQPLAALVRRALAIVEEDCGREMMKRPNVKIENTIPEGIEVFVDEELFLHALSELLANALEAMPRGGQLRVGAVREGVIVNIIIEDTGCGMAAEMIPRIFEPYYTTHTERNAIGLGIPIANAILREHGGVLQFTSSPGRGTRVAIRLPLGEPDDELTLRWRRI